MILWKSGRNKNFSDLPLYCAKVGARANVPEQMFAPMGPARTEQMFAGVPGTGTDETPGTVEKIVKNFLKTIDKHLSICYNIDNEREVNNYDKTFYCRHRQLF
jgi:hypothetical protein